MHNSIAIGTSLKLDRRTRTLSNIKDGSSVTLPASACRCLRALVEEKEKVLSYEQLMDIGWRNSGVEVTENSVRVMITKIRRALATLKVDDRIQLIAVTRSGYRLIVNIEALVITDSAAPLAIATAPPSVEKPRIWPRRMLAATAGALLGCVMVLLLSWFFKVAPQRIDFVRWQGEAVPPDSEVWVPQGLLSAAQKETITDTLKLYSHYAAGNEPNAEKARYLYITIGHSSHHMGLIACTIPLRASENNCESYYFTQR